jgi:ferric-dicitrate binding protein FerR (iron transport regulator)
MITDELLFRFISGLTGAKENQAIGQWLKSDSAHRVRFETLKEIWSNDYSGDSSGEIESQWSELEIRMNQSIPAKQPKSPTTRTFAISAAAVILILLGTVSILLFQGQSTIIRNHESFTKTYFLPDGTEVNLGPGSKLSYPKNMAEGPRIVTLTGEAYFDVVADPLRTFTVKAGLASIDVTGTKFAVNAPRKTDEVEVAVRAGKVLFYNSHVMTRNAFRMGLGAGEKGIYSPARNQMDKVRDPSYLSVP